MKFTILRKEFAEALGQVQGIVSSRASMPVLHNVLIQTKENSLKLTTTDTDVTIITLLEAKVEEAGEITLPAKKLTTIISQLPEDEVKISVDTNHQASINCGASFFKLIGISSEEYPNLPQLKSNYEFDLAQAELKDAFHKTSYAISKDETRYVLNGVHLSLEDNHLNFVATDGRRLALVKQPISNLPKETLEEVIIPHKIVAELQKLLATEGKVKVKINEKQIVFKLKNSELTGKLIDGKYPNYKQVIPATENQQRVEFNRKKFKDSINRISLLASEKTRSIKLTFKEKSLLIAVNQPEVGEASEEVPITYGGKEVTVAFNPDFLKDALNNLDEETIYFDIIDAMSPGVIKIGESFLYVIMPMRVTN